MQNVDKDFAGILRRAKFEDFEYSTEWMAIKWFLEEAKKNSMETILKVNEFGQNRFNAGELTAIENFLKLPGLMRKFQETVELEDKRAGADKEEG